MTKTVKGTYGSYKTPCNVFVEQDPRDGGYWYVVEGSRNVNKTHDEIGDGVDVETLRDYDMFTSSPIENPEQLSNAISS